MTAGSGIRMIHTGAEECQEHALITNVCCPRLDEGGLGDRDRWPEIQERMVDAMVRLERALRPQIKELQP